MTQPTNDKKRRNHANKGSKLLPRSTAPFNLLPMLKRLSPVTIAPLFLLSVIIIGSQFILHLLINESAASLKNASLDIGSSQVVVQSPSALLKSWTEKSQSIVDQMKPFSKPTTQSPFVFFHLRKCGGSSLRALIRKAANVSGVASWWIPCFDPIGCIPYSFPPTMQRYAIYASHLNHGILLKAIREVSSHAHATLANHTLANGNEIKIQTLDDEHEFGSCLTNLRPTVERVVSCYNFRMVQKRVIRPPMPPANELSAQDWADLLPNAYSKNAEGCNNEILRSFGSRPDELYINTMAPNNPFFSYEFNEAAKHLSKCVIVIPERCEDSNKIMQHFLPWIGKINICGTHINKSRLDKSKAQLAANASQVILENNEMDELLFKFGESLFEQQLRVANTGGSMNVSQQEELN